MKEFVEDFIRFMVDKFKKDNFDVDVIKEQLISQFNKKSLMYSYVSKGWLKEFFLIIKSLGYGRYDLGERRLFLNRNNDFIETLMVKAGIPEEPEKEAKKYDELIK